ncbi:DNA replication and repair protein RecF [Corynebacterium lowii]|uniref:DNA replication and repair protein RecF n=2 Tax=Corynebacterium lowii TaxID=1544413 RepID=A0A0Q0YJ73_9CORY|nr:DNA replication and repair protein RecF [Corynebacterium lowii]
MMVRMAKHPISRLRLAAFGPFEEIDVTWSPGLNVIVGDNATGKSQLLKAMYSSTKVLRDTEALTKKELNPSLATKLMGTLRPDNLGRLTRRTRGRVSAKVGLTFAEIEVPLEFTFGSHAKREVAVGSVPERSLDDEPVYLPPQELLSLSASFLGLFDSYETGFDETWRDTVELLLRPALRGPRAQQANEMLDSFSGLLQEGTVTENNGHFYLHQPGIGTLEAPLLAEGQRKVAMIARLIANGVLLQGGYLFWDEPEANLNPASQRAIATVLVHLAGAGAQVFVATHSMFLLRELQMLGEGINPRYVGLSRVQTTEESAAMAAVQAQAVDDLDELDYVAALRAESEQAQRYLGW